MSRGGVVGILFIDFSKAVDCVDHGILKQKLIGTGITGQLYQMIESYLGNRQQYVELNGAKSSMKTVAYGVPQGSLLGPILFSVYMNDLPDITSTGETHLYADDVTAFLKGETVDECVSKLNGLATEMNNWSLTNKMTINVGKTEAMIMKRKQFIGPLAPIKIGEKIVEYREVSKVLGVHIDNKLDWNVHTDKVYKKYSGIIGMLRKTRFLPTKTLEEIYYKMVIPKVTYGMLVWSTCSQNVFEKIEKQHARAAKLIKNIPRKTERKRVLETVRWDPIIYIYKRKVATEMYQILEGGYEQ